MKNSIRTLFHEIIDFAGLFPPAGWEMLRSVKEFVQYQKSPENWMLARFILPAAQLPVFVEVAESTGLSVDAVRLSAVCSMETLANDFESIELMNDSTSRLGAGAQVDAVEIKVENPAQIAEILSSTPDSLQPYLEIPVDAPAREFTRKLAATRGRAKVRTGGVVPEAIPTIEQLASFIEACSLDGVPFKATAGLHHPVRSVHALTYEKCSPAGLMHGFLNVFVAAAWRSSARDGRTIVTLERILSETAQDAFRFDRESVTWREVTIGLPELAAGRQSAVSFGSCSFLEPIDDLKGLNLL